MKLENQTHRQQSNKQFSISFTQKAHRVNGLINQTHDEIYAHTERNFFSSFFFKI